MFWGGNGGYHGAQIAKFGRLSGKHPAVWQYFVGWKANSWLEQRFKETAYQRSRIMFHIEPDGRSMRGIAHGSGDGFLLALNRLIARRREVTYLRPLSEMNNVNNPWGPGNGADNSPRWFKQAWRRMVIVVRGGPKRRINRKLRRLRLPRLRAGPRSLPRPKAAFMWVPLSFGNPETPSNHPRYWWPGRRYVDWVGTSWYSPYRNSGAMHAFYNYPLWRGKPFVFAEWAVWGADDPRFVSQFFSFLRSHRRVRMVVYYQSGSLLRDFTLSTHPRTSRALRGQTRWSRLTGFAHEFRRGRRR